MDPNRWVPCSVLTWEPVHGHENCSNVLSFLDCGSVMVEYLVILTHCTLYHITAGAIWLFFSLLIADLWPHPAFRIFGRALGNSSRLCFRRSTTQATNCSLHSVQHAGCIFAQQPGGWLNATHSLSLYSGFAPFYCQYLPLLYCRSLAIQRVFCFHSFILRDCGWFCFVLFFFTFVFSSVLKNAEKITSAFSLDHLTLHVQCYHPCSI